MNHELKVHYNQKPIYDIMINSDFNKLHEAIAGLDMTDRRFMIISDSNVSTYYLDECLESLKPIAKVITSHVIQAGEHSKNLNTVYACYEQLIQAGFDRNDVLLALGGGVVGDLTGFVAATYLRGIRFIQIPTSLLAMVDSSIGGKTGVDFNLYKNMIGAFYQPKLVYINLATLNTLPDAEFYSGMSEIIKHGLINSKSYYNWLKDNISGIKSKDFDVLAEMIFESCKIKKAVVEEDPKEEGIRALLNFGHTIGHAVEKLMNLNYLHGECVAIGIAAASHISLTRRWLSEDEYQDILQTLDDFNQPISVPDLLPEDVLEVTKHDKKKDADRIKFILLEDIGQAIIDTSVSRDEMLEAIKTVIKPDSSSKKI